MLSPPPKICLSLFFFYYINDILLLPRYSIKALGDDQKYSISFSFNEISSNAVAKNVIIGRRNCKYCPEKG